MIRAICYYTNQEEDEPSSLREQQHQCLEAVHDYGWVIHREVFDPFMKKVKIAQRSGMRTLLHEAAAHKFDLLVIIEHSIISWSPATLPSGWSFARPAALARTSTPPFSAIPGATR